MSSNDNTLFFFYAGNLEMNTAEVKKPVSMPVGTGMLPYNGGMMAANIRMMVSNSGMLPSNSGMSPGMLASNVAVMTSGMNASNHALVSSAPNTGMTSSSGLLLPQESTLMPGVSPTVGMGPTVGMASSGGMTSKPGLFPSNSGMSQNPGIPHSSGVSQMAGMSQRMGMLTASAEISSSTRSVSSHMGSVSVAKPQQGAGVTSPSAWTNIPFAYPGGDFCQPYNAAPNLYYYPASGNCSGKGI